jgi:IPT/TIG domain
MPDLVLRVARPVGTSVTVSGTGLEQMTKVTLDGKSATFSMVSDAEVAADVPTGAATGETAVTTKGGDRENTNHQTL